MSMIIREEFKAKKISWYESNKVSNKRIEKKVLENEELMDIFKQLEKRVDKYAFGENFNVDLVRPFLYKSDNIIFTKGDGSGEKINFCPGFRKLSLPSKSTSISLRKDDYVEVRGLIKSYEKRFNELTRRYGDERISDAVNGKTYGVIQKTNKELFDILLEVNNLEFNDVFISTEEQKAIDEVNRMTLEMLEKRLTEK